MKKIISRPAWDYLLFLCLFASISLFAVSFFLPKINTPSLLSYIILFILYLFSEKFSRRQINYPEKAFSYFIIYLLFSATVLYYFKIHQNKAVELFALPVILIIFISTITIQTVYFVRKKKISGGVNIKIIILGAIAVALITFSIVPRLIILAANIKNY